MDAKIILRSTGASVVEPLISTPPSVSDIISVFRHRLRE